MVTAAVNYRLKPDDITYIFNHADVELIIVDSELTPLLRGFTEKHPRIRVISDTDTDASEGELGGQLDEAISEGLQFDRANGSHGWDSLAAQVENEEDLIALAYTSGTTARPKGVEYTHRGAYLAAMANIVESGLNFHDGRCRYLWTLPMFHAMGWTYHWAVTAVRGTHVCLRKIDYPEIWRLLKDEGITHYCAAPTVNTLLCAAKEAQRLDTQVRVTVAASPPTPRLFEQMTNLNLHPVHTYGLTETYGPITKGYVLPEWDHLPQSEKYQRMARQGHGFLTSLPIRVIKVDAPKDCTIDVKKDGTEIGEVVFTGNICARAYYKDPAATQRLFQGGVLHSGDLAVWHSDGSAQILDRAKDIIISGIAPIPHAFEPWPWLTMTTQGAKTYLLWHSSPCSLRTLISSKQLWSLLLIRIGARDRKLLSLYETGSILRAKLSLNGRSITAELVDSWSRGRWK